MIELNRLLTPGRPSPMYNNEIHEFGRALTASGAHTFNSPNTSQEFKDLFDQWIHQTRINMFTGLDTFPDRDIIQGVTQFIDDIYQVHLGNVYILDHDYMYHKRLYGETYVVNNANLLPANSHLIIGMPFPFYGDIHPDMASILEVCLSKNIYVHIDAAWIGCTKNLEINFDHPAIHSIGFSLSKGLGLGYSRIGVRYSRKRQPGPVTIMNDFTMIPRTMCWWGIEFINKFGHDYLQTKYALYYKILCERCNLIESKSIHLAHSATNNVLAPVGVRFALEFLENHHDSH